MWGSGVLAAAEEASDQPKVLVMVLVGEKVRMFLIYAGYLQSGFAVGMEVEIVSRGGGKGR